MTPKLRAKVRSIAAQINLSGQSACVWILDRGADLGHGAEFPGCVPFHKHVGCYSAPCAHGDIAEDVEHALDQMAAGRSGKPRRPFKEKA